MNERYDMVIIQAVEDALVQLELDGEVILLGASPRKAAEKIAVELRAVIPKTGLTPSEMYGLRLLALQAISNKSFFDWEMPTLTGFTAAQFQVIAEKLPRE